MVEICFKFVSSCFKFVAEAVGNQWLGARPPKDAQKRENGAMERKAAEFSHKGREGREEPEQQRMRTG